MCQSSLVIFLHRCSNQLYYIACSSCTKMEVFVFPANSVNQTVTIICDSPNGCKNLKIYSAIQYLTLECDEQNTCNSVEIYCGDHYVAGYTMTSPNINASCELKCEAERSPGCIHSLLSCSGSGTQCALTSDLGLNHAFNVMQSTLECNIGFTGYCQLECDEGRCANTTLLCRDGVNTPNRACGCIPNCDSKHVTVHYGDIPIGGIQTTATPQVSSVTGLSTTAGISPSYTTSSSGLLPSYISSTAMPTTNVPTPNPTVDITTNIPTMPVNSNTINPTTMTAAPIYISLQFRVSVGR